MICHLQKKKAIMPIYTQNRNIFSQFPLIFQKSRNFESSMGAVIQILIFLSMKRERFQLLLVSSS